MTDLQTFLPFDELVPVRDGEPGLRGIVDQHYSARHYRDGRKPARVVGPGEYLILTTPCRRFLIIFRVSKRPIAGQRGIYLTFCRNTSSVKTSALIRAALERAWQRWPGNDIFTFVNPRKVQSPVPGYCFRRAGFRRVGETKGGLLVFRRAAPPTNHGKAGAHLVGGGVSVLSSEECGSHDR